MIDLLCHFPYFIKYQRNASVISRCLCGTDWGASFSLHILLFPALVKGIHLIAWTTRLSFFPEYIFRTVLTMLSVSFTIIGLCYQIMWTPPWHIQHIFVQELLFHYLSISRCNNSFLPTFYKYIIYYNIGFQRILNPHMLTSFWGAVSGVHILFRIWPLVIVEYCHLRASSVGLECE